MPGFTRHETDLIFDHLKASNFDIRGIDQDQFPLEKLQTFAKQWSANIWARHAIPSPLTQREASINRRHVESLSTQNG